MLLMMSLLYSSTPQHSSSLMLPRHRPITFFLASGDVQRLVPAVFEERILLQPQAERCELDEARVEYEHLAVGCGEVDFLVGGDEQQRAVGEVVWPAAVFRRVVGVVSEHNCVAVGLYPVAFAGRRHVDEAHKGVQRFGVEGAVALAHAVYGAAACLTPAVNGLIPTPSSPEGRELDMPCLIVLLYCICGFSSFLFTCVLQYSAY